MDTSATFRVSRILLTGPPGVGKTTICKKLASMLQKRDYKFDGFYTEEIRGQNNSRVGFDVVLVKTPDIRSPLARVENLLNQQQCSDYRVGKYCVLVNDFEEMVLPVLDTNTDLMFIDEIGKMELFSQKFHDKVQKLFFGTSNEIRIVATIPQMHKVPKQYLSLFQKLHSDKNSKIIDVNRQNRDILPEEIFHLVS